MSNIAFAIWMLGSAMAGASIGTVVMSILVASKRWGADLKIECDVENCTFVGKRNYTETE